MHGEEELSLVLAKLANDNEYQMSLSSSAYHHYVESRSMAHMVDRFSHAIKYVTAHK